MIDVPFERIRRVFIEKKSESFPVVQTFLSQYPSLLSPNVSINWIDDFQAFYHEQHAFLQRSDLILVRNRGQFLKPCPGTKGYICCGYWVLDIGNNCLYDCQYCILQSYFPVLSQFYYVNTGQMKDELRDMYSRCSQLRIGTGEFTDSLILDPLFDTSRKLIQTFKEFPDFFLEFKTKSLHVDPVLENWSPQVILSWSVNTREVIRNLEKNTPELEMRIEKASIAQKSGFLLSLHFDPIIWYPGALEDYEEAIQYIFSQLSSESIVYISLGCFRFIPDLKKHALENGSPAAFLLEDFSVAHDGKMRYFYDLRCKIYRHIVQSIRKYAPDVCLYFCMENPEMWKDVFFENMSSKGLDQMLYQQCRTVRSKIGTPK